MPQTAIISPQIIDSTSIGRDLITAADQAAAQAIIGVTGVDTGADYTWTGDHTFDGSVTLDNAEWSNSNGILNQPDINGFHYFAFSGSNVFRASALDFIPMSNGTKALGRSDLRFSNVYSVDGDFSGDVTVGGFVLGGSSGHAIELSQGLVGESALRVATGGGKVLAWGYNGSYYAYIASDFYPGVDGSYSSGTSIKRWSDVFSVDGSFSGNLINEVGGSYKLYNLGTEGDADTEYLETFWDTNECVIQPKKTGTGANRSLELRSPTGQAFLNLGFNGNGSIGHTTTTTAYWGSSYFRFGVMVQPSVNGTVDLGTDSLRWANVASVDGDFSGTVSTNSLTSEAGDSSLILTCTDNAKIGFRVNGAERCFINSGGLNPSGLSELGQALNPWRALYGVDGSFSGSLINEVGGSYKLYNLGTDGDADTEYLETYTNSNVFKITPKRTGTGAARQFQIEGSSGSGAANIYFDSFGFLNLRYANSSQPAISIRSNGAELVRDMFPNTSVADTLSLGKSTSRFGEFYSVDGDFSGNMTLSNLPTSDPAVAGQLWNDSGTVKISAG